MKKKLFLAGILIFFCSVSWGNNCKNNQEMPTASCCECKNECNEKYKKNSHNKEEFYKENEKEYNSLEIEDDEYFTYNQCFFDKRYRKMKRKLCLTRRQETCIDEIYSNFKADLENLYFNYRKKRDELLKAIECNNSNYKEYKNSLKALKSEAKEKYKELKQEIEEHLCKNQKNDFRKFQRKEKRQIRKIAKYSNIYKFPCINCCSK